MLPGNSTSNRCNSYAMPSASIVQFLRLSIRDTQSGIRFDNAQAMLQYNSKIIPLIEPTAYLDDLYNYRLIQETYLTGSAMNIIVFHYQGNDWGPVCG